ncbi:fluoride efflux transporter CrcB [Effusibacillus dendaii]|uniref:Fluoride-specific ion channel FluC n=1 Tax=Effusibacillus dendaii TaxID=2743772 RepID=A0A7I8D5Z1_9BACL|nr:fluoride efflux transporter CrcB [Effusibacillus dendaii]BCJ85505.1 putative fluoride ion transporter CrcB 2 [Effusibacillus dendaii]
MIVNALLVATGGFFGAVARYIASQWFGKRFPSVFPYGTLFVNLLGSFLLGLITGGRWAPAVSLLFGTGFMGAFTTFSTFKWESLQLGEKKQWKALIWYLAISYTAGVILAFLGYAVGAAIDPHHGER